MADHAPLPWTKQKISDHGVCYVEDSNDCSVADLYYRTDTRLVPHEGIYSSEANADLIVKCVNAYPALVAALKRYSDTETNALLAELGEL